MIVISKTGKRPVYINITSDYPSPCKDIYKSIAKRYYID